MRFGSFSPTTDLAKPGEGLSARSFPTMAAMIIPIGELVTRHDIDLGTVLHLGAHLGEEADQYQRAGAREVVWVEADPDVAERLVVQVTPFGHRAINAVVSERDDREMTFHVADNDGRSSSLLEMETHLTQHPEVGVIGTKRLRTSTVDSICASHAVADVDLLTMDLQGAELMALRGATRTLQSVRFVYTEVNVEELYRGCATLEELDEHLHDFVRTDTALTEHGWGDAFYVRRNLVGSAIEPRTWHA